MESNINKKRKIKESNKMEIRKHMKRLKFDKNLAELVGILLGDGSFYVTKNNAEIDIAFNLKKEKDYCKFVEKLIQKIIKTNITKKYQRNMGCVHLRIARRMDTLRILEVSLFKAGDKIRNNVGIPKWIWSNKNFLKACLRGLIDTDGSLYRLTPHWPNLYQLSFKASNPKLLRDTHKAFTTLGFRVSRIFENRIVVTRQKEVKRYLKQIGSNNLRYGPVLAPSRE